MHAGLGHGWPQSLGFRLGQSSEECDVVISLYSADWPFVIFKVLTGEHPPHVATPYSRSTRLPSQVSVTVTAWPSRCQRYTTRGKQSRPQRRGSPLYSTNSSGKGAKPS